ncbi:MAG: cyclase family protein [Thermoplasmata archaeon]
MRVIDVSLPLSESTPCYPGDTPFARHEQMNLGEGDPLTLSELTLSAHAGTHVDVPSHCLPDAPSLDEIEVMAFSGPAKVLNLRQVEAAIEDRDLEKHAIEAGDIVLLKTRNSEQAETGAFWEDFIYLTEDGARHLARCKVKAVGIDYLSIEGFHVEGHPAHDVLLRKGIGIIEGLRLAAVPPGRHWLLCLPLRVVGGDGAPARAVLLEGPPSAGR